MKVNQKNKTRIGISLLCAILLLTGCHITPNKKQDGEKKKYPKLVVVYSGAYGEDSSFSQVQEEINKITRKKLGVEVEFHLISDSNYSDAVELMMTSGEQVDILWGSNSLFVKAYVNRQLCDLEPLLKENGKDIIDAVGWKYINCCRIGGTLYALPNNRDFAAGWDSYALRKDILDKYASLTTRLQGKWYYNNIAKGHGALLSGYHLMGDGTILDGELDNEQRGSEEYLINNPNYNRYDFISEGDSPSFFYLLDTGLRSMEDPTYGGWGGRFGVDTDGNYRNIVSDKFNGKDDTTYTLTRWFDDIQDDFAARADWCISSDYSKSNHRPTVKVREGIDLTAKPGERIKLHADATDPDGDVLDYNWWQYYEADTYNGSEDGEISMVGKESDTMSFVVPEDAQDGDTIHMVITVKDDGAHNMTHYQRVIVKVQGRQEIDKLSLELPEGKDANAIETGSYSGWSNPYAFTITAKASNKDGQAIANKTMTWESSDEAVGTINNKGVFTPKKAGKTTITATANDGSGKTAIIELTVVEK